LHIHLTCVTLHAGFNKEKEMEENKVDRSRILEKIQKCMAMAKDARGNANEAAMAMRQAQALMRKHQITDRELGAVGFNKATIFTTIQAGKPGSPLPVALSAVVNLIQHAFGVKAIISRVIRISDANYDVNYYGPETRTGLAQYAHTVVQRAVDQAWKEYLLRNPHMKGRHGARAGFYVGWVDEVRAKVEALAATDEEKTGTELVVQQDFPVVSRSKANKQAIYGSTARAGADAADGFSIHRPVAREFSKLEYSR